ncbi:YczE/YyaS/YitT family protein [Salimicrobium halophilum]|uniref:Membrane protein YczE n=1 Tax=Salimicrobium halophilum TaxID=86666 RepID=A0A1G8PLS9_9BACI|nr:YitT family protein [Salimicrobium halophilum]SDI93454.1 hypothetical protein SAMN04490247_0073 [Salimicrobium halophilum]
MKNNQRTVRIQWAFFMIGLVVLAFGISLTIQGKALGIGPWDVFHYGLFKQLGLTIGTWSIIAGILIVLMTSIFYRQWPKIGTILNMVLIGVFIDIFNFLLVEPETLMMQITVFVTGTIIMALGIGIYVAPDLGAGPRDSLMLMLSDVLGWKVSTSRNVMEVTVAVLGWLLQGPVGVGTVFIAFMLGTMVGYTLPLAKRMLKFFIKKGDSDENINQRPLWSYDND